MTKHKLAALLAGTTLCLATQVSNASVFFIDELTVTENDATYWQDTFSDGVAPANNTASVDVNLYDRVYLTRPLPGLPGPETGGKLTLDTSQGHANIGTVNPVPNKVQRARVNASTNSANASALTASDRIKVTGLFDLVQPDPLSLYSIRLTDWVTGSTNEAIELAVRTTATGDWLVELRQAQIGVQWIALESWDLAAIPDIMDFEQVSLSLFNSQAAGAPGGSAFTAEFTLFDLDGSLADQTYTSTATGSMFQVSDWLRPEFTVRERLLPAPSALLLIGIGLAGLGLTKRRHWQQA